MEPTAFMCPAIGDDECYGGWCPGEGMTPLSQWFSFRCDTLIDRMKTIIYDFKFDTRALLEFMK